MAVFSPVARKPDVSVSDEDIRLYYEENQSTYNKKEVRLRKLSVTFGRAAKEADKKAARAKAERALERIRQGEAFADVARAVSDDSASKGKGGDAGFQETGKLGREVEKAVGGLVVGQVSDVVETPTGFLVLKLEELRQGRPLNEVSGEIRGKLIDEGAERIALDAAYDFADAMFDILEGGGEGESAGELFSRAAKDRGIQVKDTSFFREGGSIPPFGYDRTLSGRAFALTPDSPISEPIKGKKDIYVACWLETKEAELPELAGNDSLLQRVKRRVRKERAIAAARKRARQTRDKLIKAMAEGTPFEKAGKGMQFTTTEPFTRLRPPPKISYGRRLMAALGEAAPGTLLELIETDTGAALVYVVSRTLASDEKFEGERGRYEMQVQWTKRQAVLNRFYEQLERESDTVLTGPWAEGS